MTKETYEKKLPRIYLIGDSISLHYGPYLEGLLRGKGKYSRKEGDLEAMMNLDEPAGSNGGDSSRVASFLEFIALNKKVQADLLVVNCGLHDIKRDLYTSEYQIPLGQYEQNLGKILTIAPEIAPKMMWISTTPVDDKIHNTLSQTFFRYDCDCRNYNNAAEKIMTGNKVPIIDLYAFTQSLPEPRYCDHVHFTEEVREQQAGFLATQILPFLKP